MRSLFGIFTMGLLITGCSGSSSGGAGTSVSGTDMSGAYVKKSVECYSTAGVLTAKADFSTSSIMTISGNSYDEKYSNGTCESHYLGKIVFSGTSAAYTQNTATTAPASNCSYSVPQTGATGPTISPTTYNYNAQNNHSYSDATVSFVFSSSTNALGFQDASSTVSGRPTDTCFTIYIKQ